MKDIWNKFALSEKNCESAAFMQKWACANFFVRISRSQYISSAGIDVEERKIWAVSSWERSKNLVNMQSFLGLCNYCRKFVRDLSTIANPLTNLTKSKIPFEWNREQEKEFTQLKKALMNTPILRCAGSSLPNEVQTDASETGIGAVLQQKDKNGTRPVAHMSRKLNAAEKTTESMSVSSWLLWVHYMSEGVIVRKQVHSKNRSQTIAIFTNSSALVSPSGALCSFHPGFSL
jgi:hypothetical protein